MKNFLEIANSQTLFILCLVPILLVVGQSVIFVRMGLKRTKELNMNQMNVKKAMVNSAVFSLLPSLPIVITVAALMPSLGKYVPWLRLSVIGSVSYESAAADMTLRMFGYEGMGDASVSGPAFISAVWVMCGVSIVWPLVNVLLLKFYDGRVKSAQSSGGFMKVAAGAMFIGLMCVMFVPRAVNFQDPVGIVVCLTAGIAVVLLDWISKKLSLKWLSDFSFPMAMIMGMAMAIIIS
ncbi:DUF5058 family protein [Lachnospiraceae bacterium OttesenSCG-928-J05]|nr:DUF5058 family protein [Lachnospiraceae bacterium OttesenSCG-928-J05]